MNKQGVRRLSTGSNGYYKVVVGVSCLLCDTFVPGKAHKLLCDHCILKWGRKTPRRVIFELNEYGSSGRPLPPDLRVWHRIVEMRKQGIYSLISRPVSNASRIG